MLLSFALEHKFHTSQCRQPSLYASSLLTFSLIRDRIAPFSLSLLTGIYPTRIIKKINYPENNNRAVRRKAKKNWSTTRLSHESPQKNLENLRTRTFQRVLPHI
jgi:hypothetical protein